MIKESIAKENQTINITINIDINLDDNKTENKLVSGLGPVGAVAYETLKIHAKMLNTMLKQLDAQLNRSTE